MRKERKHYTAEEKVAILRNGESKKYDQQRPFQSHQGWMGEEGAHHPARIVTAISRTVGHTQPFLSERRTVAKKSGTNMSPLRIARWTSPRSSKGYMTMTRTSDIRSNKSGRDFVFSSIGRPSSRPDLWANALSSRQPTGRSCRPRRSRSPGTCSGTRPASPTPSGSAAALRPAGPCRAPSYGTSSPPEAA